MKRFAILVLSLFAFLAAPQVPSKMASAMPRVEVVPGLPKAVTNPPEHDIQAPGLLELLMQEQEEPAPSVSCMSVDGSDHCVPKYRFSDEVNKHTAKKVIAWIDAANEAGANEILIELNTPGGSVDDGFEIMKAIEDSKAPVSCVVDGDAESMGFGILQSCTKRYMTPRSKLMAHEPALGVFMFRGNPNQWQAIADMLKATRSQFEWQCQHRLKISMKEYQDKTSGSQMWFVLPPEAKKVGAVDELVGSVKEIHQRMLKK